MGAGVHVVLEEGGYRKLGAKVAPTPALPQTIRRVEVIVWVIPSAAESFGGGSKKK
jgi:hypothetical protein